MEETQALNELPEPEESRGLVKGLHEFNGILLQVTRITKVINDVMHGMLWLHAPIFRLFRIDEDCFWNVLPRHMLDTHNVMMRCEALLQKPSSDIELITRHGLEVPRVLLMHPSDRL